MSQCLQVAFDTGESLLSPALAAVPPVLYCTSAGVLCSAHAEDGGSSMDGSRLLPEVLQQEMYGFTSFDLDSEGGQDILAATGDEHLLLLHRGNMNM